MSIKIQGVIPAMLTPFKRGGVAVDYDRAAALADHLAKRGIQGLYIAGTTGEGLLMSLDERKQLLEVVLDAVGKRVKVIPHTGCLDTLGSIALTQHAAESGAPAAAIVAPGYYRYDVSALTAHFQHIAAAAKGYPIMLYDLPGATQNPLGAQLILHLAKAIPNVVGVKDSSGRMQQFNEVVAGAPKGFIVINGVDEYTYQAALAGGHGSVSSTANVACELFSAIYKHVADGKLPQAWKAQVQLGQLCGLFQYGAMVAIYKEAMRIRGFDAGYVRPPQRELTRTEKAVLQKGMKAAGLI